MTEYRWPPAGGGYFHSHQGMHVVNSGCDVGDPCRRTAPLDVADAAVRQVRATKTEAAVLALRELAKTCEDGYTGLAAYECSDRDTERAEFLAKVATDTADRLEQEADRPPCPYTQSHTRAFCGDDRCRES